MDDTSSSAAALAARRTRLAALPPLRDVLRGTDLSPKKSLGQHFLFDLNLTDKVARTVRPPGADNDAPLLGRTVVEVGPGPGGLTRSLLAAGASVIAVEKDTRAVAALAPLNEAADGALHLVADDALRVDWPSIAPAGALLCANLPYNVATPLIVGWLSSEPWPSWWAGAALMVQREVAQRMVAAPGDQHYGRLAVLTGWRCHASIAFDIAPSAFVPPPKVWSSVVRLDPHGTAAPVPARSVSAVTAAAFGQRRKMLRSSLKALAGAVPEDLLQAAGGIAPTARAEELSVDDFLRLAAAYAER